MPFKLFCDSNLANKFVAIKHFEIDLHFVREKILAGVIKTEKTEPANEIADILTKGLDAF